MINARTMPCGVTVVGSSGQSGFIIARWVVLRGLAVVFFSAFYSFAFQIQGLIGPRGISPAVDYLAAAREQLTAPRRYLEVPTLFWLTGASTVPLGVVVTLGFMASLLLFANWAPRVSVLACTTLFLSIISVSGVFASYQSDGMLLEAGLLSAFFAPRGLRPGLGVNDAPTRIARFMLVWEWFRIYFESETYVAYPYRYKPQDPKRAPGIYAPYQPRFEWNLWFASLGTIRHNRWVARVAARLLAGEPCVLGLFAWDPFAGTRPKHVRTVIYRYWFTDFRTQRNRGEYWHRELLGAYAPALRANVGG